MVQLVEIKEEDEGITLDRFEMNVPQNKEYEFIFFLGYIRTSLAFEGKFYLSIYQYAILNELSNEMFCCKSFRNRVYDSCVHFVS